MAADSGSWTVTRPSTEQISGKKAVVHALITDIVHINDTILSQKMYQSGIMRYITRRITVGMQWEFDLSART